MREVLLLRFILLPASPIRSCLYVSTLASHIHCLPSELVFWAAFRRHRLPKAVQCSCIGPC